MESPPYTAYVPVYNQAATLRAALEGLKAQTPPPVEILVVDDGSTDGSAEIAAAMGATVLRQDRNRGRGAARARAVVSAKTEFVLACDAGNRLPPEFAERTLAHFHDHPRLAAVHGWFAQTTFGGVVQRWRSRHLFAVPSPTLQREATHVTGGCMVRRSATLDVGNYSPALRAGEDAELGRRLHEAGWEVWLDPSLRFESLAEDRLGKVFERYARWNEIEAPTRRPRFWRDYLRRCAYAIKVLAARDLREGDPLAVFISLALPHYLAWSAWRKRDSQPLFGLHPVIHYVNTYAEPWLDRCWRGEMVSRAHLWGADALVETGFPVQPVFSKAKRPLLWLARWVARLSGGRIGDLAADLAIIRQARQGDVVYVAAGQLLLVPLAVRLGLLRVRLVSWIYKPPAAFSWRSLRPLFGLPAVLKGYDGWLALTPTVETWLRENYPHATVRRVVWAADTDYYPVATGSGEYFAATGVTQRDYETLLAAARAVKFPFVILGPENLRAQAPATVTWRTRKPGQPHTTIDDDELRELYRGARAVLIPLLPDPTDASGYTNLLEAIATGRPVVMTRTGALDLTPGVLGIGYDIAPCDTAGWIAALETLAGDARTAVRFADRAAELARDYFNLPRFDYDLTQFFVHFVTRQPDRFAENPLSLLGVPDALKSAALEPSRPLAP